MKTEKTIEELVALIQSGIDVQENTTLLLQQCKGFVCSIAKRYPRSSVIDLEDLIQEGLLGVMKAVETYKDQDSSFKSYAAYHIKNNIRRNALEPCLGSVRIPTDMFALIGRYRKFGAIYRTEFGMFPSGEEVIQRLGLSEKQYRTLKRTLERLATVELNAPIIGTEEQDETYGDSIADDVNIEDMVIDANYRDECSVILWGCLESLGDRESIIMAERYFDNMTLQEIADKHRISNGRVGHIEQRCLRLLREMDEIKALRDDYDYAKEALKRTGYRAWKENNESCVERAVRKKMELESRYNANLAKLEEELNDTLEDLKIHLLNCTQERREQIESMFNRKYDEIVPHILKLPDKSREMFIMAYVLGMKNSDIAKQKDIVWNAVKSGKNYAILKLNEALAG